MNPREPETSERGLRELVVAGAARLESEEPRFEAVQTEAKHGSWRVRKRAWEEAPHGPGA